MAFTPVTGLNPQYDEQDTWWLKFYKPETTTPIAMATSATGETQLAKAQLDVDGFITTDGTQLFIPFVDQSYDAYLFPTEAEADANDTINAKRIAENINPFGLGFEQEVNYYPFTITAGQTSLTVPDAPNGLILVKDGDTQEQGEVGGDVKDFTYNRGTGVILLTTALTGNEQVFVIYGAIVAATEGGGSDILSKGYVTYEDFGVDLTGVEVADNKLIEAHTFANENNLPVIQNKGTVYWRNKTIEVKTPTDLTGMTVRMDENSGTPTLTYAQPIMYKVPASEQPIALGQASIDQLNGVYSDYLRKLSHTLPNQIFGDYNGCLVKIIGTELDVQRGGNPLSFFNKEESVTLSRRGEIEQPIYKGFVGTVESVTIYPREKSQLLFKCPNLLLEEVASFSFLRVERSNTKVTGLVITEGSSWPSNVREVVQALNVQDFIMQDWDCLAMPLGTTNAGGVYCFTGSHIVRLRANRLRGNGGWGFTGCNFIRSVSFIDNDINRIDCHWGAYDVTCINNRIINFGCLLAGGGTLTMRDNEYHITGPLPSPFGESIVRAMVEIRPDYGAEWDGDILVDGLTYIIDPRYIDDIGTNEFDVVKMVPSPSNVDFGRAMYHGRSITVKNVILRMDETQQNDTNDTVIALNVVDFGVVNVGAQDQFYPHTIIVDNVTTTVPPNLFNIIAYTPPNYMAPRTRALYSAENVYTGDYNQLVVISNVSSGRDNVTGGRALRGLVRFNLDWSLATGGTYPDYLTDTSAIRPKIIVKDCFGAALGLSVVGSCEVFGGEISQLQTRSDSVGPVFGPDETQMPIKCHGSRIRAESSFTGQDSWEFPDETWAFNCEFSDLVKRDGTFNAAGIADRFKGRGNRKIAETTAWTSTTPLLFDGENAYLEGVGSPVGSVVPEFIGQQYKDTSGATTTGLYVATGATNADWVSIG